MTKDDRIAELEEEVRFLRHQLGLDVASEVVETLRWRLGLSPKEAELLAVLYAAAPHRLVSRDKLMMALYPNPDDAPDDRVIDVYVCKIRAKLRKKFNVVKVETHAKWHSGWKLGDDERSAVTWALALKPARAARPDQCPPYLETHGHARVAA